MLLSNLMLLGPLLFSNGSNSGNVDVANPHSAQFQLSSTSINLISNVDYKKLVFKFNDATFNPADAKIDITNTPTNGKFTRYSPNGEQYFIYNSLNEDREFYPTMFFINAYNADIPLKGTFSSVSVYMDMTASTSTNLGSGIIDTISDGLGLMEDIASEFLNGFTTLFWKDNQLTTFGQFALIFLGISITFSIIKLCLNLIRGKTGA